MSVCPTCDQPVVRLDNGLVLNPKPGRLGRHLKDGTRLTGDQIRDPFIPGYYEHRCLPQDLQRTTTAKPNQDSLF